MRNPGGLVCRRTAENSYDLGLGSTPGPLFPGRRSWQQPGSLCGGPSGQKEEVHWQPSEGTQPAPPARTQVAPSALSRAPRSSRHGACQETPESWEGPGQEPLTCPSVLRSRGWRGAEPGGGVAVAVALSHLARARRAQCGEFLGTPVLQRLLRLEQAAALPPPCTQLAARVFSLPTAGLDRPPAHPFSSSKGPQPLLQHLKTQCWESQQWQG